MIVDFAFLADGAEVANGKIYILGGGIDTFWTDKEPFIYPKVAFAMRLIFDVAEIGRTHNLEIQILGEDGANIQTIGGPLTIPKKSPNLPQGWQQGIMTVLNFVNLQLPRFGNYSLNILVNNSNLKSIPLRLAQKVNMLGMQSSS